MASEVTIGVFTAVGSPFCVASADGQKVFEKLVPLIETGIKVRLSFLNIKSLTSAFLNAAIGQLYGKFTEDQIRENLFLQDIEQDDLVLIKRVVDTAKEYFKNPDRFEKAKREIIGEEDEH